MGITYSDTDVDSDEHTVQIAALTPSNKAVIIGNGTAWTTEVGATLRESLGLAIGSDVMAYDADLAAWAGVNPSSYSTTAQIAAAYQPLDSDLTAWAAVNPSSYSTTSQIAAAYQPLDADLTSWAAVTRAAGFDAFAATPTSANLRTLLSDESGSGALLFAGGALGTPASGVLTNCTGLPNASVVGLGTAALKNTGTSGNNVPLLDGTNLFGAARNQFAANSEQFAIGVRWGASTGSFWFGASNSATPDGIFSDTSGTEVLRLLNGGGATLAGDRIMTRGATETITGIKTHTNQIRINTTTEGIFHQASGADIWITSIRTDVTGNNDYLIYRAGTGTAVQVSATSRAIRFNAYGAGTLVTDSSGNITASSDEELKYIVGDFTRGLSDLRAMDRPVNYQWRGEQMELAEATDAINDTEAKLAAAQDILVAAAAAAAKEDATEVEKHNHRNAKQVVTQLAGALADQKYRAAFTREETTYTGWTAQGVRKGIPEAVKAGPDGLLNFDERPVLAAIYNAMLELAARVEALEAAQ